MISSSSLEVPSHDTLGLLHLTDRHVTSKTKDRKISSPLWHTMNSSIVRSISLLSRRRLFDIFLRLIGPKWFSFVAH